jgi:hypothetical protein
MDIILTYTIDSVALGTDVVVYEFLQACGIISDQKRKMRIEYDASPDIALLSNIGIRPTLSGFVNADCPSQFSKENINQRLSQMNLAVFN